MKKIAEVNLEYEFQLFHDEMGILSPKRKRIYRKEYEFIFFFINQDKSIGLANYHNYTEEYLRSLENLGVVIPNLSFESGNFFWFGKLENLELERKLNSKLWIIDLLAKLNLSINDQVIVSSLDEVKSVSKEGKWFLRSAYPKNPTRNQIVELGPNFKLNGKSILEPYCNRILDIIFHYDPVTKSRFVYLSTISKNGTYIGGTAFVDINSLKEYLDKLGLLDKFQELEIIWENIFASIKDFPLDQPLTIDSFFYEKDGEVQIYPMTEINYRRNMGCLLKSLLRFAPPSGVIRMLILSIKKAKRLKTLRYDLGSRRGIISLAEENDYNCAYLLCGKNLQEIAKLEIILKMGSQ